MSKKLWLFTALDSWFFRDGSPFDAGEGGQRGTKSMFPPFMNTLQGAIRTVLAQGQGWSPEGQVKWPEKLGTPDDLGDLRLDGPYLHKDGQWFYPAPLHLVGKKGEKEEFDFIRPGEDEVECDLGLVRLPKLDLEGAKPLEGRWVRRDGLEAILRGSVPCPCQILKEEKLWEDESRIGLERKNETRTAVVGHLYSTVHVRPVKGLCLGALVDGVPPEWHPRKETVIPLGGEGRLARVEVLDGTEPDPQAPELTVADGGKVRFMVTLATPGWYERDKLPDVIRNGPPDIPGDCVSACIGKMLRVGGWDLARKGPRPLEPVLPAGSCWFMEASANEVDRVRSWHGKTTGPKDKYGYGKVLIGNWGGGAQ